MKFPVVGQDPKVTVALMQWVANHGCFMANLVPVMILQMHLHHHIVITAQVAILWQVVSLLLHLLLYPNNYPRVSQLVPLIAQEH